MGKLFYSPEETAAKLNLPVSKLAELEAANKLRHFNDGNRAMYKIDEVDRLAAAGEKPIELSTPAASESRGTGGATPDAGDTRPIPTSGAEGGSAALGALGSKAEGSSAGGGDSSSAVGAHLFDLADVKPADPSAQTHISEVPEEIPSPSGLEAVGSGSGLLDLTREADNTSLGAELLEEIYPGDQAGGSKAGIGAAGSSISKAIPPAAAAPAQAMPAYMQALAQEDPQSGFFGGLALASLLVMGLTLLVGLGALEGFTPHWALILGHNQWIFAGVLVVAAAAVTLGGWFFSKLAV